MSCDVLGMRTVNIKMRDGVVMSLSEVRHVPELRRNLISLCILDVEDYLYKTKEGKLLVTQGLVVIIRGKIQPNNEVLCTKEKQARDLTIKEPMQRNEATSVLITSWARKSKDKVHQGEVKTRDDRENIVRSVSTEKMLLIKVVMEGTPRRAELDTSLKKMDINNKLIKRF
ncbi:unnamed protein product [Prunus armeniaca]